MERILVYGMTDNPGGIESYLINMLQKAREQDVMFDFVTVFDTMAYADDVKKMGSHIYHIPQKSENLWKHWKAFADILRRHKEYRVVYFNILDAGAAFTMLIPWLHGRKIFTHSHNGATDKQSLHKLCKPFMNKMTKRYIACSKLAGKFMFGENIMEKGKVLILPNAIDIEKYVYDAEKRRILREQMGLQNKFVVCHVGRLFEQKNPFGLIDIFEKIWEQEPDAVLLSVGGGPLEKEFKEYIHKKELDESVQVLGVRKDIPDLLQCADVFLLPSFYEGLPIVAIEAQAAGLPCVLSDAITDETNVTGNVTFVSLEDTKEHWADVVCACKGKERQDTLQNLTDANYNIRYLSQAQQQLLKWFKEFGRNG